MRARTLPLPLLLAAAAGAVALPASVSAAGSSLPATRGHGPTTATGPGLSVDLTAGRHAISPYVYGMNFADEALATELRLPVRRWGGNATTRYNFRLDTTNRAADWFFENIPGANADPGALPDGSETDQFVDASRRAGAESILTMPLIGWAPKARAETCGFSVTRYGPQQATDPWRPDCGNGVRPDGTRITGNDPHDTSVEIGDAYVRDWVDHLKSRYGKGGVRFYDLDNEPDLWHETHRDVHPDGAGYDEIRARTIETARAVKAADPSAQTLGFVGWGYYSLLYSGKDQQECNRSGCWDNPPDKVAHGGVDAAAWYLRQMRAYERAHRVRLVDYFDNHIYPQQAGVWSTSAGDSATQALRLRSTRLLWDPTYVDESWIDTAIRYIPRLKELVRDNYPGTRTAISEYNWGALNSLNGALAQADILGIFGREGLDLATLWDPPTSAQPGAYAFRMFRNYDGAGAMFGETAVRAQSKDQDRLSVYAAQRRGDKALTLLVVNKTGGELTSPVRVTGGTAGAARVYRYSDANLAAIVREPDQAVTARGFTATFPANSITVLELPTRPQEA